MTCIGRRPDYMTEYVFIETGWSLYLRIMTSNLWIAGAGPGLYRAYSLTENGTTALFRLNAERGICDAIPARESENDG